MNAIDTFPPADLPLVAKLPKFNPVTSQKLIDWGLAQPGSLPWLLKRSAAYWDKFPGTPDEHHYRIDCTSALDLLRWRIDAPTAKEAVEHLWLPLDKPLPKTEENNNQQKDTPCRVNNELIAEVKEATGHELFVGTLI